MCAEKRLITRNDSVCKRVLDFLFDQPTQIACAVLDRIGLFYEQREQAVIPCQTDFLVCEGAL